MASKIADDAPEYRTSDEEDDRPANHKQQKNTSVNTASFKDFLLKEELIRAIEECGFEKPSPVQSEAINYAVSGRDILCQAQAGTGKTAVFVLAILNQMEKKDTPPLSAIVLAPARELAQQIRDEFNRFGKYLHFQAEMFYGGVPINNQIKALKENPPHIIVGCPGRLQELIRNGLIKLDNIKYFVVDECDRMLSQINMRDSVQHIFVNTPKQKQTMMFSGTMPTDMKLVCKKFLSDPIEIIVEDQSQLVLNGLDQYQKNIEEKKKIGELARILEILEYNQVMIFVNKIDRASALSKELNKREFYNMQIHGRLDQSQRTQNYTQFKDSSKRILVATELFGRGMDFSRVNMVINFDMPETKEMYMHRVGRAGRQFTKGIAISFVSSPEDKVRIDEVQKDFKFEIKELPNQFPQ